MHTKEGRGNEHLCDWTGKEQTDTFIRSLSKKHVDSTKHEHKVFGGVFLSAVIAVGLNDCRLFGLIFLDTNLPMLRWHLSEELRGEH